MSADWPMDPPEGLRWVVRRPFANPLGSAFQLGLYPADADVDETGMYRDEGVPRFALVSAGFYSPNDIRRVSKRILRKYRAKQRAKCEADELLRRFP